MKKIFTLIVMVFCAFTLIAQAPEKFTYQAIVRNASNALVVNTPVGVRVIILQGGVNGTLAYMETHTAVTNANGLLTLEIGGGSVQQGTFASINWANGPYFLKTETDPNGGNNYSVISTQQLLSVPYALYAREAGNGFSGDYNDLANTPAIPTVPTNVSAFTNDAGYITIVDIPEIQTNVSTFNNDAGYITAVELQQLIDEINLLNNRVDSLENLLSNQQSETQDTIDAQPCPGNPTVTDYDGNVYNTVQIGNQCWMKENLKTNHYSDGTSISLGTATSTSIAYRYYPNNNSANIDDYGYLYNWKAVRRNSTSSDSNPSNVQGVCPTGWHVPSRSEWLQLISYVGSQSSYVCTSNSSSYVAKALAYNDLV